jgi:hypothetical protein
MNAKIKLDILNAIADNSARALVHLPFVGSVFAAYFLIKHHKFKTLFFAVLCLIWYRLSKQKKKSN